MQYLHNVVEQCSMTLYCNLLVSLQELFLSLYEVKNALLLSIQVKTFSTIVHIPYSWLFRGEYYEFSGY